MKAYEKNLHNEGAFMTNSITEITGIITRSFEENFEKRLKTAPVL